MAPPRRSARLSGAGAASSDAAAAPSSSPASGGGGRKRKAAAPEASSSSPTGEKKQKTLEETAPVEKEKQTQGEDEKHGDEGWEMVEKEDAAGAEAEAEKSEKKQEEGKPETKEEEIKEKPTGKADPEPEPEDGKEKQDVTTNGGTGDGAVEESADRAAAMPSNILEKGVLYFFVRGRVDSSPTPEGIQDIARTYIVLRPLPHGAKLGDGAVDELSNCRLLALPKKVLPRSGKDTFMVFVDKAGVTAAQLKEEFMTGSSYNTQTTGVRHTPPVTPVGEGVYALTTTGRESHIAYMLTVPEAPGDVQKDMGIAAKGSFILSVKNPEQKGPPNSSLPDPPAYPREIMDEFKGRRWMPLQPKHLDYVNAQMLFIGESHGELGKAVEAKEKDVNDNDKKVPEEEIEELQDEDLKRVKSLNGDDAVFHDLGISKDEHPRLQTTW